MSYFLAYICCAIVVYLGAVFVGCKNILNSSMDADDKVIASCYIGLLGAIACAIWPAVLVAGAAYLSIQRDKRKLAEAKEQQRMIAEVDDEMRRFK